MSMFNISIQSKSGPRIQLSLYASEKKIEAILFQSRYTND